jgi:hypothetical protein
MSALADLPLGRATDRAVKIGLCIAAVLIPLAATRIHLDNSVTTIFLLFVSAAIGLLGTRTASKLIVGARTDTTFLVETTLLLGVLVFFYAGALLVRMGVLFLAATAVWAILSAWVVYGLVAARTARLRDHPSRLDADIDARGWFLKCVASLIRLGAPSRLVFRLWAFGKHLGLYRGEAQREVAKTKVMLLFRLCRFHDVIEEASAYNRPFPLSDETNRAVTLVNYKALAFARLGEIGRALSTLERARTAAPANPYYAYTHARLLWSSDQRELALATLNKSLELYEARRQRSSPPMVSQRIYFLEELAVDAYFHGDKTLFGARLDMARDNLLNVWAATVNTTVNIDLVHNCGNLLILDAFRRSDVEDSRRRTARYRGAAADFLWCTWHGTHFGARLRIALLQAIGTRNHAQAIMYLRWLQSALQRNGYHSTLPLPRRVRQLLAELKTATAEGWVFDDKVLLHQSSAVDVPALAESRITNKYEQEVAEELREAIFSSLRSHPHMDIETHQTQAAWPSSSDRSRASKRPVNRIW